MRVPQFKVMFLLPAGSNLSLYLCLWAHFGNGIGIILFTHYQQKSQCKMGDDKYKKII